MNPLVEQSVRHAKRFGDPQTVFETAYADRVDWGNGRSGPAAGASSSSWPPTSATSQLGYAV